MLSLALANLISVINLAYAAMVYLSLHGWIVPLETSGMQLILHVVITAPIALLTTLWFYYLHRSVKISARFWQVNLLSFLVPLMSIQTGVTFYHYDKIGLLVCVLVPMILIMVFVQEHRGAGTS